MRSLILTPKEAALHPEDSTEQLGEARRNLAKFVRNSSGKPFVIDAAMFPNRKVRNILLEELRQAGWIHEFFQCPNCKCEHYRISEKQTEAEAIQPNDRRP